MARNVDNKSLSITDFPQDAISIYHEFSPRTITHSYGVDILRNLRRLEKSTISKRNKIAQLSFLKKCRDNHIIPTFGRVLHILRSNRNNHIFNKMSVMLVRDQIRVLRFSFYKLDCELLELHFCLSNALDKDISDY